MAVISRVSDITIAQKWLCDDLLIEIINCNHLPYTITTTNPDDSLDPLRATLWAKVFANGWHTEAPNPAPAPLRKRKLEETALYVGTLNEDAPIKSKGNMVPEYRRARAPVQFKASFSFSGKLDFYWIDDEGQKLPVSSVDIEGGLTYDEIKGMVAAHYDANEMERVGAWNWEKIVHWSRARITNVARRANVGAGIPGLPLPSLDVIEDPAELHVVRLVEHHMKQEEDN